MMKSLWGHEEIERTKRKVCDLCDYQATMEKSVKEHTVNLQDFFNANFVVIRIV